MSFVRNPQEASTMPIQNYSAFTALFNTTGQPAVMLPLWQAKSGLPLAMQFVGRLGERHGILQVVVVAGSGRRQRDPGRPVEQRRA